MGENRKAVNAILRKVAKKAERAKARQAPIDEFADELRGWWSFDNRQHHTHSWHTREDFIAERLPKLLSDFVAASSSPSFTDPPFACPPDEAK